VAKPGDEIENPVTGERIVFRQTASSTNGEALEYELFFRPRGFVAQQHLHPRQQERHEVLSGRLGLSVDGEERVLEPGDSVVVPAATSHRLVSFGEEQVHALFELKPALRSEVLIETFAGLARDGKVNAKGYPKLLQLAVIAREFEQEGYATKPPLGVQRVLLGALAALGRARGYRPRYPEYSGP
jgi:mannose-6-phosphate isomerase-like protein (cupin superfamily)